MRRSEEDNRKGRDELIPQRDDFRCSACRRIYQAFLNENAAESMAYEDYGAPDASSELSVRSQLLDEAFCESLYFVCGIIGEEGIDRRIVAI